MPRALWSGSLSFGLVNIPVKLVSAVRDRSVRFHLIHEPDGSRIKLKKICAKDGQPVAEDEIVKGYEVSPGRHVLLTSKELEALDPEASRTIDILDFVELKEIDPAHFDHPYFLVPDKAAGRAYALLHAALRKKHRVGIARAVMRGNEYLVAIRATPEALTLETMRFADEVLPASAALEDADVSVKGLDSREVTMAEKLIETLASPFEPERYKALHRDRVLQVIEQKAEGEEIVAAPTPKAVTPRAADLLSALEKSVAQARKRIAQEA